MTEPAVDNGNGLRAEDVVDEDGDGSQGAITAPRVLLVEDSWHYADALGRALNEREIDLVAIAETAEEARRLTQRRLPDVALVDVALPDGDGISLCRELLAIHPGLCVVLVSATDDIETGRRAIAAGAVGYIVKHGRTDPARCADAVRAAARGDHTIDRDLTRLLMQLAGRADNPAATAGLTPRDIEVLTLVAAGRENSEIAAELHLQVQTVKNYVGKILMKLDASNRTHAVAIARRLGIVD